MFYLVGIFRTSSPGDSVSSDPERMVLRSRGRSQVIKMKNPANGGIPANENKARVMTMVSFGLV